MLLTWTAAPGLCLQGGTGSPTGAGILPFLPQSVLGAAAGAVDCFPSLSRARGWEQGTIPHSAAFCLGP